MNSEPGAREDRAKAAPDDVPHAPIVAGIRA